MFYVMSVMYHLPSVMSVSRIQRIFKLRKGFSEPVLLVLSLLLASTTGFSSTFDASGADVESTECELTTSRTLTVIKSVRFPEAYGPNVDCRYAIRRRGPSVCSVTFLFNVLDLEPSPSCQRDYIKFHDTGETLCGSKPVGFSRTVSFKNQDEAEKGGYQEENGSQGGEDEEVIMSFHSDNGTKGGLGYMVTVVQQECPKASCDSVHSESSFVITSPNYPLPYDNSRICTYVVHKFQPTVCKLFLTVRHFDVEEDEHCEADFFRIGKDGQRLCGALAPGQIVELSFLNDSMLLEFQSDHVTTRDGFQIDVRQEECHQQTIPSSTVQEQQTEAYTTTPFILQTSEKTEENSYTPENTTEKRK